MTGRRPRGRLREEILDAAGRILLETGDTRDVSIEAVVAAVGCTPPALYYYFPSKEQLLYEVCDGQYRQFADALETAVLGIDEPVEELVARGHAYLQWAVAHPEHYRVLFMSPPLDLPNGEEPDPRQAAGLAELIGNLERAIAARSLASGDVLQMSVSLWSAVHGIASLAVTNQAIPLEFAHHVLDLNSRAILQSFAATQ